MLKKAFKKLLNPIPNKKNEGLVSSAKRACPFYERLRELIYAENWTDGAKGGQPLFDLNLDSLMRVTDGNALKIIKAQLRFFGIESEVIKNDQTLRIFGIEDCNKFSNLIKMPFDQAKINYEELAEPVSIRYWMEIKKEDRYGLALNLGFHNIDDDKAIEVIAQLQLFGIKSRTTKSDFDHRVVLISGADNCKKMECLDREISNRYLKKQGLLLTGNP